MVHSKGLRFKSRPKGRKELQGEGRIHVMLFKLLAQSCKLLQAITEGRGGDEMIQKPLAEQLNIKLFQVSLSGVVRSEVVCIYRYHKHSKTTPHTPPLRRT